MIKKILVIGAGMVAPPLVKYLLDQADLNVTVGDIDIENARKLVQSHPRGTAVQLDAKNRTDIEKNISNADIVISLLPWKMHPTIAVFCLSLKKHLVTASYVKEEMQGMDGEARKKGLIFLNEVGVDPGIDHMAAMKIIEKVKDNNGEIVSFYSYCGGLPALKSNNNPLGYKFSWSPEGAMLAATNPGQYLRKGKTIQVPGNKLFEHYWLVDIPGAGVFEAYVNRDALPYLSMYGIRSTQNIYRGTLRNIGYCETWDYFKKLGLLNQAMKFDFNEVTPRQVIANIINSQGNNLRKDVAAYLNIPEHSLTLKKLAWLGFFNDKKLPLDTTSVFEMFAHTLRKKLVYNEGETDVLIQHHKFQVRYADGKREKITSTLINEGVPNGSSSMSRTVGLPVAISAKLIAQGKISQKGVQIPVSREIYEPVLAELKNFGIEFIEHRKRQRTF